MAETEGALTSLSDTIGGTLGVSGFSLGGLFSGLLMWLVIGLLVIGGGIGIFFWLRSKKNKKERKLREKTIIWWSSIGDKMIERGEDQAEEILVPGSSVRLFYVKKRDLWLPRFTEESNQGVYFVAITKSGEMVNFTVGSIDKDLKQAGLYYDHGDTRLQAENEREFIHRNYRQKAVKWWQAYLGVISTVVLLFAFAISMAILIYMLSGVVQDIGSLQAASAESTKEVVNLVKDLKATSGIIA